MANDQSILGVVFWLNEQPLALPIQNVVRAIRAVAVTPLLNAPSIVRGVINLHGEIVPVVNIRQRFGLPDRELACDDHILIARTPRRLLALPADQVSGVIAWREQDFVAALSVVPETKYLKGILVTSDGLILVQDLGALLSLEEEEVIDHAIALPEADAAS